MSIDSKRVKEIFLHAADLSDEAARAAYLDQACGGDVGLRGRVEALLRSHDPAGSFLGTPAAALADPGQAALHTVADDANAAASGTDPAATEALSRTPARHGSTTTDVDDEPLTFLSPPQRPDSL